VVEVVDLLAENEVVQQHRATRAGLQGVLVVGNRRALVRGERRMAAARGLMDLAGIAGLLTMFGAGLKICHGVFSWSMSRNGCPLGTAFACVPAS